jgi:hypothetical protein
MNVGRSVLKRTFEQQVDQLSRSHDIRQGQNFFAKSILKGLGIIVHDLCAMNSESM